MKFAGGCEFFRDLAVDLRLKLGDWFRVVQLLKTGGGGGEYNSLPLSLPLRSNSSYLPVCPNINIHCKTIRKLRK